MSQLAPRFSSNRMLREYVDNIYMPATNGFRQRIANGAQLAKDISAWQNSLERYWAELHFGEVQIDLKDNRWTFQVPVYFGEVDPSLVTVQLYADSLDGWESVQIPMTRGGKIPGALNGYIYQVETQAVRPAEHFTPRIIPTHPDASIPLEDTHILWQK